MLQSLGKAYHLPSERAQRVALKKASSDSLVNPGNHITNFLDQQDSQ